MKSKEKQIKKQVEESTRREVVLYNKTLGGSIEIIDLLRKELKRNNSHELQEIKSEIQDIKNVLKQLN
ncbi:hypothetical protein [Methanobacterium sp. ACI-7]|uniref:hypothetical protein n=1 Tax=unclassified Methanobacterium TaxID=2627676 RepID=UPI0039C10D9C